MEEELKTVFDFHRSGLPYPPIEVTKDTPILLCLAGFPDSASVWDPLTNHKELQSTHHVITMGLPGFQEDKLPDDHKWGYSQEEIQEELHQVVLYCHRRHPCNQATIHLVGHDWGAMYCYTYIQGHAERIDKYCALDIGLMYKTEMSLLQSLSLQGYFALFSLAFIVNNLLSKMLASLMIKLYPWGLIGPLDDKSHPLFLTRPKQAPHTTYPYFQFMKANFTGKLRKVSFAKIRQTPQCFVFGSNKLVMYHSKEYLKDLEEARGCSWHTIEGAGHWFYTNAKHSHHVAKIMSRFFLEK